MIGAALLALAVSSAPARPLLTGRVVDPEARIRPEPRAAIGRELAERQRSSGERIVVLVDRRAPCGRQDREALEALARAWGLARAGEDWALLALGATDPGACLVRGGSFPLEDARSARIVDRAREYLEAGRVEGAARAGARGLAKRDGPAPGDAPRPPVIDVTGTSPLDDPAGTFSDEEREAILDAIADAERRAQDGTRVAVVVYPPTLDAFPDEVALRHAEARAGDGDPVDVLALELSTGRAAFVRYAGSVSFQERLSEEVLRWIERDATDGGRGEAVREAVRTVALDLGRTPEDREERDAGWETTRAHLATIGGGPTPREEPPGAVVGDPSEPADDVGAMWRTGPAWGVVLIGAVLALLLWATCVPIVRGTRVAWLRLPVPVLFVSWAAHPVFGPRAAPWIVGAFAAALVLARLVSRHEQDDERARAPGLVGGLGDLIYWAFLNLALLGLGAALEGALGAIFGGGGGRGGGASWGGGGGRFSGGGASGKW